MKAKKALIDSMSLIGLGINATLNNPEIQDRMTIAAARLYRVAIQNHAMQSRGQCH